MVCMQVLMQVLICIVGVFVISSACCFASSPNSPWGLTGSRCFVGAGCNPCLGEEFRARGGVFVFVLGGVPVPEQNVVLSLPCPGGRPVPGRDDLMVCFLEPLPWGGWPVPWGEEGVFVFPVEGVVILSLSLGGAPCQGWVRVSRGGGGGAVVVATPCTWWLIICSLPWGGGRGGACHLGEIR